jgi:hypothetical protein
MAHLYVFGRFVYRDSTGGEERHTDFCVLMKGKNPAELFACLNHNEEP